MVVWIVGLAGSGKTTIGQKVFKHWKEIDQSTVFIDGDKIREIFKHDKSETAYTISGRLLNAERISQICLWLDEQGINVVCCILSIFNEGQDWNRKNYKEYLEVYLDTPFTDLENRRSLYKEAKSGIVKNVVGIDIPFTPPHAPDLKFNSGNNGPGAEAISKEIFNRILGIK